MPSGTKQTLGAFMVNLGRRAPQDSAHVPSCPMNPRPPKRKIASLIPPSYIVRTSWGFKCGKCGADSSDRTARSINHGTPSCRAEAGQPPLDEERPYTLWTGDPPFAIEVSKAEYARIMTFRTPAAVKVTQAEMDVRVLRQCAAYFSRRASRWKGNFARLRRYGMWQRALEILAAEMEDDARGRVLLDASKNATARRAYDQGVREGMCRAHQRPGDGDMGG